MIDIEKLKALAGAASDNSQHYISRSLAATNFSNAANPAAVLELIAEIELDNAIIAERELLLAAIPECAAHGRCVPYAIQWVKDTKTKVAELLEERDQLKADNEALRKDAERYRWFRGQHWDASAICAVTEPKSSTKLGSYCPSGDLLDQAINSAMSLEQQP